MIFSDTCIYITLAGAEPKPLLSPLFSGGTFIYITLVGRHKGSKLNIKEREGKSIMTNLKETFMSSQALLSMLLVQVFATGMQLLSRVILVQGTFIFALLAYRHLVAAVCVFPLALYFERYKDFSFYSFD